MKLLIVRNDKLGDFITTLPAIYLIKQYDPTIHITVLVSALTSELAQNIAFIDDVIVDNAQPLQSLAMEIRIAAFDASITMFSNTRVALAQYIGNIAIRIAPATKLAQIFYNQRIVQRRSRVEKSEYAYNIDLARALFPDLRTEIPTPLLQLDSQQHKAFMHRMRTQVDFSNRIVLFHPGSGGSTEANLSLSQYIELADVINAQNGFEAIFTFGPDEEALLTTFKALRSDMKSYQSKEGLVAFAHFISHAFLFVSTSTGPYHLAAALGVRSMTFFGASKFASVARWQAVSDEALQHPFMLAHTPEEFDTIKAQLHTLCTGSSS